MKKMVHIGACSMLLVILIAGLGDIKSSSAADAAQFYKGKVLEFIVPYSPGGGTDVYARMVGPYIQRYLGATVVIKNMPGAGGIYGNNFLYKAKPNGLKMAIIDTGAVVLSHLFKDKGVRYDFNKFICLGNIVGSKRVFLVAKNSALKTFSDLQSAKSIKISSTGKTSGASLTWALLAHALDWPTDKISHVLGYGGGRELMMAVLQGETDTTSLAEDTAATFVREGLVRAILTVDRERSEFLPDTPTPYEQVNIPEEKDWPLDVYLSLQRLRRGLITTPGVPQDKVDFLQDAIEKALKDKELLASAAKVKRDIKPVNGKEMGKQIKKRVGALTEKQIEEFRFICFDKYFK